LMKTRSARGDTIIIKINKKPVPVSIFFIDFLNAVMISPPDSL
jgi:hypothetical protein